MDTMGGAVELYFTAGRRDLREVSRVRALKTETGRRELLVALLLPPVLIAGLALRSHVRGVELMVIAAVGLLCGLVACLAVFCSVTGRLYAKAPRNAESRCEVSDAGLSYRASDGTVVTYGWDKVAGWTETRNLFVFRQPGTDLLGFLPKRGALIPDELDRVRETFGRHAPRL